MTQAGFRKFVLNADDFAMDEGVDAAILELAERRIVTSASAMVLSPAWPSAGRDLARAGIVAGLHLDFTSPFVNSGPSERSISALVTRAYSGALDRGTVRSAIARQLTLFEEVMARPPHFVDGHRHVHQLPIIREQLIACLQDRYGANAREIKLRSCRTARWRGAEAAFVSATGARALEKCASLAGLSANSDFAGVYGFSKKSSLEQLWTRWLSNLAGSCPLIMCHPAKNITTGSAIRDPIRESRFKEYIWLSSSEFSELCKLMSIVPASWT